MDEPTFDGPAELITREDDCLLDEYDSPLRSAITMVFCLLRGGYQLAGSRTTNQIIVISVKCHNSPPLLFSICTQIYLEQTQHKFCWTEWLKASSTRQLFVGRQCTSIDFHTHTVTWNGIDVQESITFDTTQIGEIAISNSKPNNEIGKCSTGTLFQLNHCILQPPFNKKFSHDLWNQNNLHCRFYIFYNLIC